MQGEISLFIRLLERKFGTLSKEIQTYFGSFSTEEVLDCIERLATVQCLEELLPQYDSSREEEHLPPPPSLPTVLRTSRGLTISGTRLTLYDIMDYMKQNWSAERIQKWFRLSEQQITDISEYITHHRIQIEAEYQQVVYNAQISQQIWREKNRELFAKININQYGRQEFWTTLHQCQLQRKEE